MTQVVVKSRPHKPSANMSFSHLYFHPTSPITGASRFLSQSVGSMELYLADNPERFGNFARIYWHCSWLFQASTLQGVLITTISFLQGLLASRCRLFDFMMVTLTSETWHWAMAKSELLTAWRPGESCHGDVYNVSMCIYCVYIHTIRICTCNVPIGYLTLWYIYVYSIKLYQKICIHMSIAVSGKKDCTDVKGFVSIINIYIYIYSSGFKNFSWIP